MKSFDGLMVRSVGSERRQIYIATLKPNDPESFRKFDPMRTKTKQPGDLHGAVDVLFDALAVACQTMNVAVVMKSITESVASMGGEFLEDADVKEEFYTHIEMIKNKPEMPDGPLCLTWIPTRKCNLRCEYCGAIDTRVKECGPVTTLELVDVIAAAFPTLQFWCLLGGDVLVWKDDLIPIVEKMSAKGLFYGITSNSVGLTEDYAKRLVDVGLSNWTVSLDSVKNLEDTRGKKAKAAIRAIKIFKELKVNDLHCTVTVSKDTIDKVIGTVRFLGRHMVWAEITPFIWGKTKDYDYSPRGGSEAQFQISDPDLPALKKLTHDLSYSRQSSLVHNLPQYLDEWPRYAVAQDWKCRWPWNLVVDADARLKPCLHLHGKRTREFTVWDGLQPGFWGAFLDAWVADVEEQCHGCYWNCQREPEIIWEKTKSLRDVERYFRHGAGVLSEKLK